MMKQGYVYIMTNKERGTLYIGVTSNLIKRVWEHKNSVHEGFTKKYNLHRLVYYETIDDISAAIKREKKLKKMFRYQKLELIEVLNPSWDDLYESLSA